jgi:hypothetical protein
MSPSRRIEVRMLHAYKGCRPHALMQRHWRITPARGGICIVAIRLGPPISIFEFSFCPILDPFLDPSPGWGEGDFEFCVLFFL